MEGSQTNPLFRVTGIPLHTHNATALLEVEMSMINEPIDDFCDASPKWGSSPSMH